MDVRLDCRVLVVTAWSKRPCKFKLTLSLPTGAWLGAVWTGHGYRWHMAAPWLAMHKLAAPAQPDDFVSRDLDNGVPALLLLAGPGYGKTLGLLSLVGDAPTAWYALDEGDADPATFFHGLLAAVRAHIPPFGTGVETLLAARRLAPRLLWQHFFGELAAYNLPSFQLVLDDVHTLLGEPAGKEIVKALGALLERLPPGVRVLMASRRPLPGTARAVATQRLAMLSQAQLAFSAAEAEAFVRGRLGSEVDTPAWQTRLARLDGWPLGLALATVAAGEALTPVAEDALAAYIEDELFATLAPELQAVLLQAAMLQEVAPNALEAIFERTDVSLQLAELEAAHLLGRLAGEHGTTYRMAGYLRAFLDGEARRRWPDVVRAAWQRRAAAYYEAQDRGDLAVSHWIAAGAWEAAIAACDRCFPALRYGGQEARIARWLEAFPAEVRAASPVLLAWEGHLHTSRGQPAEAEATYARAQRLFEEADDDAATFKLVVRRAILAVRRGDGPQANRVMLQALARVPDGVEEDLADLHLARAMAADQRGDLALMAECNQAVLAVPIGGSHEIAASQALAALNLHTHALHRGELAEARRQVERARELAEAWRLFPTGLFATFLAANLRLVEGDVAGAGALLAEVPEDWRSLMDWQYEAIASVIVGHHRQLAGDARGGEEALRRSQALFARGGYAEGKKLPLERLMWAALERGACDKVLALRAEAGELAHASIYDLALALPEARALHLLGRPRDALALLDDLVPSLASLGAALHLARARLFEAAAARDVGDDRRATAAQALAHEAIARHGYTFLLHHDPRLGMTPAVAGAPPAAGLDVVGLGALDVRVDGVPQTHWPRRKAKQVLAALLLYPRGLTLHELGDLLEADGQLAPVQRNVSALRQQLEPGLAAHVASRFVAYEDERYRLRAESLGQIDLRAFDAAAVAGDSLRDRDPAAAAVRYAEALGLYGGDLFDDAALRGLFAPEREAYRRRALDLVVWLAGFERARGGFSAEAAVLERGVAIAPTEESLYMLLMRHHIARGNPERVKPLYWDCRKALKLRLGLAPSEEFEREVSALTRAARTLRV